MPRPEHIEDELKDAKDTIKGNVDREVEKAFKLGVQHGEFCQRKFLLSELERYKDSSTVAKLLFEMMFEKL